MIRIITFIKIITLFLFVFILSSCGGSNKSEQGNIKDNSIMVDGDIKGPVKIKDLPVNKKLGEE